MKALLHFCEMKLEVTRVTAVSYIDEAALPYREKYNQENPKKWAYHLFVLMDAEEEPTQEDGAEYVNLRLNKNLTIHH